MSADSTVDGAGPSRLALVTGGNRGIGLEIARQLAALGHRVLLTARDPQQAEAVAAQLDEGRGLVTGLAMDVGDEDSVARAFAAVERDHGLLEILVNNAGIAIDGPDHLASSPDWNKISGTWETNLLGAWRCMAAAVPMMRAGGYGRIVNVSSTMASLGLIDSRSSPAYRVSKVALNMLTKVLALELAGDPILVNVASPGYTRTDMSPDAERPVEQGADTPVWLATLPDDGPTGGFFYEREPLSW
jgi:NAD(P)-dependent dehydrogenase (short-subunit alcohol dehydrogenase family)